MEKTIRARAKYIRIAPRKTRLLADAIRRMSVNEAEAFLFGAPQRSRDMLLKLLRSAVANARNVLKTEPSHLVIKEIKVDGGPKLKRWMPRARGGVGKIEKKTSHITITLGVSEKPSRVFLIQAKKKKADKFESKEKQKKKESALHEETGAQKITGEKNISKKGISPKMFSRKSI